MEQILSHLKKLPSHFVGFIKTAFAQPYTKRFTLLTLIFTIVFTAVTFPYGRLINQIIKTNEKKLAKTISLESLEVSPLGRIAFNSGTIIDRVGTTYKLTGGDIKIAPIKALLSKRIVSHLEMALLAMESKKYDFKASLSGDIDLKLDGKTFVPKSGSLSLDLKKATLKGIKIQSFEIPAIEFKRINSQVTVAENLITIESLQFTGNDLAGILAGTIDADPKVINRSKINITINIKSSSKIIENYKMFLSSYINPNTGGIRIKLTGNMGSPKVAFEK